MGTTTTWALGSVSVESPFGTKILTMQLAGMGATQGLEHHFDEPAPIPHATGIRCVVTAGTTVSTIFNCNFNGYEK
jgi:hypothetical protein